MELLEVVHGTLRIAPQKVSHSYRAEFIPTPGQGQTIPLAPRDFETEADVVVYLVTAGANSDDASSQVKQLREGHDLSIPAKLTLGLKVDHLPR